MHNLEVWRTPPFIVCFHPFYQSTLFSGKMWTPTLLQFFKISNPHPLKCVDCPLWIHLFSCISAWGNTLFLMREFAWNSVSPPAVQWRILGVHSVRLHPGGGLRGAPKRRGEKERSKERERKKGKKRGAKEGEKERERKYAKEKEKREEMKRK